jgi:hypothetical protein
MTDEDTQKHKWIEGAAAKLIVSYDDGVTWTDKTTIGEVPSNWPGLMDLGTSDFLFMYDHNGGVLARKVKVAYA